MLFVHPNWSAPLDTAAHIAQVPEGATAKGFFFSDVIGAAKAHGCKMEGYGSYIPFKNYPLTELMRLLVDVGKACFPDKPVREQLRQVGRRAYPAIVDSLAGKVLFAIAGREIPKAMTLTSKAYNMSIHPATVTAEVIDDTSGIIHLKDVWNFVDCYHVGIFEGAIATFGKIGDVTIRPHGPSEAELQLKWR